MKGLSGTPHPFVKNETIAFIDTIVLFARFFPKETLQKIAEITGKWPWLSPRKLESDFVVGFSLWLHQPSCAALELLAAEQETHNIIISRLDVAFDFLSETAEEKHAKTTWLVAHALLRYRRKGWMRQYENTMYWSVFDGRKPPARSLALYDDEPSKLGGSHCTHFEFRLYNSSLSRLGLLNIKDVIDLDPSELFKTTITFTCFDIEQFIRRRIRKAFKENIIKGDDQFTELWNSNLLKRLQGLYKKLYQQSAQRAKDVIGYEKVGKHGLDLAILQLPNELSWRQGLTKCGH